MSEANDIFYRFAPFIRDFIYDSGWQQLRGVQLDAARVIFDSDDNLLLSSSTASGKTEAAFFPILSILSQSPRNSFGALYIAPLKSLINDQFSRMDELLTLSGIPVFHWHGDVAASHKSKALANPQGILQITPESLESILINRSNDVVRMFSGLEFVIIDEVHILTGSDRGNQIICQLDRIAHLIGHSPRRIGLSATVGSRELAADWLGAGSGRPTRAPAPEEGKLRWRLGAEHFYIQNASVEQTPPSLPGAAGMAEAVMPPDADNAIKEQETPNTAVSDDTAVSPDDTAAADGRAELDAGYEYIYDCCKNKKCLVFSNSREETEYVTATLRQIASHRGDPDVFNIHHGNLSTSIREEAELLLKNEECVNTTCATVTLELGIDIGRLERIIQLGSPNSVSSFLQRLGRSGRRGDPPEMMLVFREEDPLPNTPLPQLIPWDLLRAIAIIQLYIEERFIEPPRIKRLPFSLLFQQTLSMLSACGELTAPALAGRVLALPPFSEVPTDDYKTLLVSMIEHDFVEMTERKGLIVGLAGERLTNSFKFYAVFKDTEDYTVRCQSDEIGTITTPPPVGDRFALAGRVWEVEELDVRRKLIYVKQVDGKMEISWPGDYGEIHTKILERMRRVLEEDTVYPYLKKNARHRLEVVRALAANTGMLREPVVSLGGFSYCMFPWLGTRAFRTVRKYLSRFAARFKLTNIEFEGCYYITFRMEKGTGAELITAMATEAAREGIDPASLIGPTEAPVFEKYDDYIPAELLRHAYAVDRLSPAETELRLKRFSEGAPL